MIPHFNLLLVAPLADQNGNGRHLQTIPPDQFVRYWKVCLSCSVGKCQLNDEQANYASYQVYGVANSSVLSENIRYAPISSLDQYSRVGFDNMALH